jgi:hypothetical protein
MTYRNIPLYEISVSLGELIGIQQGSALWPDGSKPIFSRDNFMSFVSKRSYINKRRIDDDEEMFKCFHELGWVSKKSRRDRSKELTRLFDTNSKRIPYVSNLVSEECKISISMLNDMYGDLVSQECKISISTLNNMYRDLNTVRDILQDNSRMVNKYTKAFKAAADTFNPKEVGLSYYTSKFRETVMTLLCIHKFHNPNVPKDVFMTLINELSKDYRCIKPAKIYTKKILNGAMLSDIMTLDKSAQVMHDLCSNAIDDFILTGNVKKDYSGYEINHLRDFIFSRATLPLHIYPKYAKLFKLEKRSVFWPVNQDPILSRDIVSHMIKNFIKSSVNGYRQIDENVFEYFPEFRIKYPKGIPPNEILYFSKHFTNLVLQESEPTFVTIDTATAIEELERDMTLR